MILMTLLIIKEFNQVVCNNIERKMIPKLITRMAFTFLSTTCNYSSIKNMSLTMVGLFKNVAPLYTAILSYILLKEGITKLEVVCLVLAFIGVGIILNG
jgi:drug/metabolite transporter (DMT)-like permease